MTELINVSTFTAWQTIKRAATIQRDEAMLHLLLGVNDDLMAAEAKYHKNCYSLYTAKKVRDLDCDLVGIAVFIRISG